MSALAIAMHDLLDVVRFASREFLNRHIRTDLGGIGLLDEVVDQVAKRTLADRILPSRGLERREIGF